MAVPGLQTSPAGGAPCISAEYNPDKDRGLRAAGARPKGCLRAGVAEW